MLRRVVELPLLAPLLQSQGVGPGQAVGGLGVFAAGVEDLGQAEQQRAAQPIGQRLVEPLLEGYPIGVGQLATEQGRQVGQRRGGRGVGRPGPAITVLGRCQVAQLLVQAPLVEQGVHVVGLQLEGAGVTGGGLGRSALLLQGPAQLVVPQRQLGPEGDQAFAAGDNSGIVLVNGVGVAPGSATSRSRRGRTRLPGASRQQPRRACLPVAG